MKLLLDECLPKALKHNFLAGGHECSTVPEAGFAGKTNGQLLALAVGKFEVLVTLDKGVPVPAESGPIQYRSHFNPS